MNEQTNQNSLENFDSPNFQKKRLWVTPTILELDFTETQSGDPQVFEGDIGFPGNPILVAPS
ncbi:MAG: hypothetical protein AAF702_48620 [Chloroflexota bacterium]